MYVCMSVCMYKNLHACMCVLHRKIVCVVKNESGVDVELDLRSYVGT